MRQNSKQSVVNKTIPITTSSSIAAIIAAVCFLLWNSLDIPLPGVANGALSPGVEGERTCFDMHGIMRYQFLGAQKRAAKERVLDVVLQTI